MLNRGSFAAALAGMMLSMGVSNHGIHNRSSARKADKKGRRRKPRLMAYRGDGGFSGAKLLRKAAEGKLGIWTSI